MQDQLIVDRSSEVDECLEVIGVHFLVCSRRQTRTPSLPRLASRYMAMSAELGASWPKSPAVLAERPRPADAGVAVHGDASGRRTAVWTPLRRRLAAVSRWEAARGRA